MHENVDLIDAHSAQFQLAVERSYLQQVSIENRSLSEKSFQLEALVEKLQQELSISEKAKSQYKSQLYSAEARIASLEQKLKSTNQTQLEQEMEISRLTKINKDSETTYESTISQLKAQVRELESTLDATKTLYVRDKLKHEKDYERLKMKMEHEQQLYLSISKRSIEYDLDFQIHEENKATIMENSKVIKELKNHTESLEESLGLKKIECDALERINSKIRSRLKRLEKKIIPTMKNELERQGQYISFLQQKLSTGGSQIQPGSGSKGDVFSSPKNLKPFKNDNVKSVREVKDATQVDNASDISIDKLMNDFKNAGL